MRLTVGPTHGVMFVEHAERFDRLVTELHRRHLRFRRSTIERLVERLAEQYKDALIQDFVPLLVRREADDQLRYVERLALAADPSERQGHLLNA